jgi:hypothetical protein
MRKINSIIFFCLLGFCVLGQGKEFFQLEYKDKQSYKEFNNFLKDSVWRFNQTVSFDIPNSLDEESWKRLVFEIKDTLSFLKTKSVSLPKDISKIDYEFHAWGVSAFQFPPDDSTSITGTITLLESTREKIFLGLDLEITNLLNRDRYYYKGDRVFGKTNSVYEFYQH